MGIRRLSGGDPDVCLSHLENHHQGGKVQGSIHENLRILRGQLHIHASLHKHRYDIGLMPVIGIPLPFISYGGSSLLAFTIMLFIFIALESNEKKFAS